MKMDELIASENLSQEQKISQFKQLFEQRLALSIGKDLDHSDKLDRFRALAFAVRDEMITRWLETQQTYYDVNPKRIYFFSLEFLIGRTLRNSVINLELEDAIGEALDSLGISFEELAEMEWDAGLGNGGLGRLAACFLDSMATLELPAYGYGIRYEFGMFRQSIVNLQQQEFADNWLRYGNPWEIRRTTSKFKVHFMGRIDTYKDREGIQHSEWVDTENVIAVAYDVPIPGFRTKTVNTLRLWAAAATREFNLQTFNDGDYIGAVFGKFHSETISKVLYPNDNNYEGKELRLKQQYFMVSASLQDVLFRMEKCGDDIRNLPQKAAIQLNDTHPSIAIPELMRILVDEKDIPWEEAWDITTNTFAYTNHTVLPEALEKWPVPMLEKILPRHIQIIIEINQRFLDLVSASFPGDFEKRASMSIIEEGQPQNVRMSHLAIVGSFSVNGVAELHSRLLREGVFNHFYQLTPSKFNNKTNGVTPRRWVRLANPGLARLITSKLGEEWIKNLDQLKGLENFIADESFVNDWIEIKRGNKKTLANYILRKCQIEVNQNSMFDVQVKRIHEYKRQLLNILHVITLYNRIRFDQAKDIAPRTIIFGGKAAPGYVMAKKIIHLINSVANLINRDTAINDLLKVVFIPNYGVATAEKIIPGADLSEQISTAGMEASGTGNMKFALNGALTIGTLDGANIEILQEVGQENIFIFGKSAEELVEIKQRGYDPKAIYDNDQELQRILDQIKTGYFSPSQLTLFEPITDNLLNAADPFLVLADYRSYIECQKSVAELFKNEKKWHQTAILNVARMGKFSTDRTIREYASQIWNVEPCPVNNNP
ncbi:glycogen/starch/alpha-glucan phosphorylase [bacterium]|nr:glycogen/starch/alpha-glucan phosphorylase [bacterium]